MPKRKGNEEAAAEKRQRTEWRENLVEAIKEGSLRNFKKILNQCPAENGEREKLLNFLSPEIGTFLHVAAEKGHLSIINWLFSDKEGEGRSLGFNRAHYCIKAKGTALHLAIGVGNIECFHAIVNGCFVENGERGKILNAVDRRDYTILHQAADCGDASIIQWILSEGGGRAEGFNEVLARAEGGMTPLHIAVRRNNVDAFHAIVTGLRADNGEREEMLNAVSTNGLTILHLAAAWGYPSFVHWLFSEGRASGFKNVAARTESEETALHLAARNGCAEIFHAIVKGCLVDNGERKAMLNAVDKFGATVLHKAVSKGIISIVQWLLSEEEGGGRSLGFEKIAAKSNSDGETALHTAALHQTSTVLSAVVNGLRLDNGERREMMNGVNNKGATILHEAVRYRNQSNIAWILSEDGGRAAGFDSVLAKTAGGNLTALHCAVQYPYNSKAIRALLSNCTNEERMNLFLVLDNSGWTVLHRAARSLEAEHFIRELLSQAECSMIVNMKDNRGMTALHRAIIGGIDEESLKEWAPYGFHPNRRTISALLGLSDGPSSSSTASTPQAWIDPNIGLGL